MYTCLFIWPSDDSLSIYSSHLFAGHKAGSDDLALMRAGIHPFETIRLIHMHLHIVEMAYID